MSLLYLPNRFRKSVWKPRAADLISSSTILWIVCDWLHIRSYIANHTSDSYNHSVFDTKPIRSVDLLATVIGNDMLQLQITVFYWRGYESPLGPRRGCTPISWVLQAPIRVAPPWLNISITFCIRQYLITPVIRAILSAMSVFAGKMKCLLATAVVSVKKWHFREVGGVDPLIKPMLLVTIKSLTLNRRVLIAFGKLH